jgi:hypothetical protein
LSAAKPAREPWHPANWEEQDAGAIQALSRGDATDAQQRRALEWIVHAACMTYDEPFVPGRPDVSDYLAGRMSVGRQIVKLTKIDLRALREARAKKEGQAGA